MRILLGSFLFALANIAVTASEAPVDGRQIVRNRALSCSHATAKAFIWLTELMTAIISFPAPAENTPRPGGNLVGHGAFCCFYG